MNQWISVTDSLPGLQPRESNWFHVNGKRVSKPIIARFEFPNGQVHEEVCTFRTSRLGGAFILSGASYGTRYFTHWMPMPDPPAQAEPPTEKENR